MNKDQLAELTYEWIKYNTDGFDILILRALLVALLRLTLKANMLKFRTFQNLRA